MRIAVLLSTYNGEAYLQAQLESILAQQGDLDLDIHVRDDGSQDGTCAILDRYAREGKLTWYTGENLRPAKSFLDLVRKCTGYDAYAFCDQDDVWYPQKLQWAAEHLCTHAEPCLYFADARLVDRTGQSLGRNLYRHRPCYDFYSLVCAPNVLGCTCVFNEALARLLRRAEPESPIMHDCYAASVCALFDGSILFDDRVCMDYRQHGTNVVGASHDPWAAVKDRLRRLVKQEPVSIARQAQSLLQGYPEIAETEKGVFLRKVACCRDSFFNALALACSRKFRCASVNMGLTVRLATLLRKR